MCVTFVKREEETIEHLLYECEKVYPIWEKIFEWLKPNLILISGICVKLVILGTSHINESNIMLNLLLLIVKKYIYSCKYKREMPNINAAKHWIKRYHEIEKIIYGNSNAYCQKWGQIKGKLEQV